MKNRKKHEMVFNLPLLVLLMILAVSISSLLTLVDSNSLVLKIVGNMVMFIGFFCCLFIMIGGCYCLYKIMISKCYCCHKKLENRNKKVMVFLLTPPWRKRKVEFICEGCYQKNLKTP